MKKTIVYYVSSHGLGHQVRTAGVVCHIPKDIRLIMRSASETWFRQGHLGRQYEWRQGVFDCGAIQTTSLHVDETATIAEYARISRANTARLDDEVAFLEKNNAKAVVTDVPSYPLAVAACAGIPGVLVTNFTWKDIYEEFANAPREVIIELEEQYCSAMLVLKTPLSLPMTWLPNVKGIPNIVRYPKDVSGELRRFFGIADKRRLVFLSVGQWSLPMDWDRLSNFPDVAFLAFKGTISHPSVYQLDQVQWPSQHIVRSVDAVMSKAGYGTVTECLAGGTPLIYMPREGFSEQEALEQGLDEWGGGIRISEKEFYSFNVRDALDWAFSGKRESACNMNGGEVAAKEILALLG